MKMETGKGGGWKWRLEREVGGNGDWKGRWMDEVLPQALYEFVD